MIGLVVLATASIEECRGQECLPGIPFVPGESINQMKPLFEAVETNVNREQAETNFWSTLTTVGTNHPFGHQYAPNSAYEEFEYEPGEEGWSPLPSEKVDMCGGGQKRLFGDGISDRFRMSGLQWAGSLWFAHGNRYYEVHDFDYQYEKDQGPDDSLFVIGQFPLMTTLSSTMSVLWFKTPSDACDFTSYVAETLGATLTVCETTQASVTGPPRKLYKGADDCEANIHWLKREEPTTQSIKYAISAGECPKPPDECLDNDDDDDECVEFGFKKFWFPQSSCEEMGPGFYSFQSTTDCLRAYPFTEEEKANQADFHYAFDSSPLGTTTWQMDDGEKTFGKLDGNSCTDKDKLSFRWLPAIRASTDRGQGYQEACRCNMCDSPPERVTQLTCPSKQEISGDSSGSSVPVAAIVAPVGGLLALGGGYLALRSSKTKKADASDREALI